MNWRPYLLFGALCPACIFSFWSAFGQTEQPPTVVAAGELRKLGGIPSVSGHEKGVTGEILTELTPLHPVMDNLGDVSVTIGSGAPHRLIVTPVDEPGFVVSSITDDGYLRLQRSPQSQLPAIFNELYSAQPVKIGIANGSWIDGVVAGLSVHLQIGRTNAPNPRDIENMYVDIGASSAAEARTAGVDILSPVTINRAIADLDGQTVAGASVGDKFGAAVLIDVLRAIDPSRIKGTLTVAFVVQQWLGARGLERVVNATRPDELIYVGRLLAGGTVPGMEGVHRAPRRDPGSGVLVGVDQTSGTRAGLASDLKTLADMNRVPLQADYSAGVIPADFLQQPSFPNKWIHMGVATAWGNTPAEEVDLGDLQELEQMLELYTQGTIAPARLKKEEAAIAPPVSARNAAGSNADIKTLIAAYGVSRHEDPVRDEIRRLLPPWAKPQTDATGNLILNVGSTPAGSKADRIFLMAHMDETGFEVKSISRDGRLELEAEGRGEIDDYAGHPALVHSVQGDHDAIIELPNHWDEANFQWPQDSETVVRADVGARNVDEIARLGIKPGDTVTVSKAYRSLAGTRVNARSLDDRVGCAALISAVRALGEPLKDRDVTFVWTTQEEIGLRGAAALAGQLSTEGREPNYVFAVDTFVSSDSPLESKRFADAALGKGFVVRALDDSNAVPQDSVERIVKLARANQIPAQYGVTGGGNDGSEFVPYGAIDLAIGWPLRYSHSPAELIDTRDADALSRILAAVARSW
jgi:putative aminopeptidase FrvX